MKLILKNYWKKDFYNTSTDITLSLIPKITFLDGLDTCILYIHICGIRIGMSWYKKEPNSTLVKIPQEALENYEFLEMALRGYVHYGKSSLLKVELKRDQSNQLLNLVSAKLRAIGMYIVHKYRGNSDEMLISFPEGTRLHIKTV